MDKWFKYLNETRYGKRSFGKVAKTPAPASSRSSAAGIKRSIKTLTDMGGNTGGNPSGYKRMDDPLQGKKKKKDISAPPGAPGGGSVGAPGPALEEGEVEADSFEMNDELEPRFWRGEELNSKLREAMIDVALKFLDGLALDVDYEDITLTGSLANYNWSNYSDVDLHIIVDFSKVDENVELVKAFFDAARANWNDKHDITMKGYDVEIYVENVGEGHKSSGVYSVLRDEWIVKPRKPSPTIDFDGAMKKADEIESRIYRVRNLINNNEFGLALRSIDKLKKKIRNMRRAGLASPMQEFSIENIAFKILRRNGMLDFLGQLKDQAYDEVLNIKEVESEVY
jgi:hypothetical protein